MIEYLIIVIVLAGILRYKVYNLGREHQRKIDVKICDDYSNEMYELYKHGDINGTDRGSDYIQGMSSSADCCADLIKGSK